ncbi:hypothetical protein [Polaribacter porphyrae]|uniref:Uncharacterized protein n=1 Tax=Polaribacter porphyrae TaxID=1137780 RepID=A0A2S7WJM5_9FLAO|nr:hypothetical protein [Polaribacter porphyrae]PQJ77794.1 hypothetical protein BTO18_00695 [Polaribacter porphyrae]
MKFLKKLFYTFISFTIIILSLFYFDVLWKSPSYYKVEKYTELEVPVMNMKEYDKIISTHRRPYIYSIKAENGATVSIVGVEHTNDKNLPQFDSIKYQWIKLNPDIALVEGRMGIFFSWIHNPIEEYGESGLISYLAKKENKELFTWEPTRQNEIELLIQQYTPKQLAMFYCLRPYFSFIRNNKNYNAEEKIDDLINERTDYTYLKNTFSSYKDLDKEWKKYYPNIDWRNYSNKQNYMPEGIMYQIWNSSNLARNKHLIQIILTSVKKGKNIIATVGVSHAPRIEQTLLKALKY